MLQDLTTIEVIKLFVPIIIIEMGLKILCIYLIVRDGVKNLSKMIWGGIVVLVSTFGPIAFLLFGRRRENHD